MNKFHVQIQRGNEWRDLTTIRFDPAVDRIKDGSIPRHIAYQRAQAQLLGWRSYQDFIDQRLRLVESVDYFGRKFVPAVAA